METDATAPNSGDHQQTIPQSAPQPTPECPLSVVTINDEVERERKTVEDGATKGNMPLHDEGTSNKEGYIDASHPSREAPSPPSADATHWHLKIAADIVRDKIVKPDVLAKNAVAKVNLGNKIGTKVEDLPGDAFLKVLGLAIQRSLRDFGKYFSEKANETDKGIGARIEGVVRTPDEMDFKAEVDGSRYTVRQPGFNFSRTQDGQFSKIRSAFGISERQYYSVFGLQGGRTESNFYVIGSNDASGKSRSFFFLSPDQRFILKSCTSKDVRTVINILDRYREYVESQCGVSNVGGKFKMTPSSSLLPRCLGLYKLKFGGHNKSPPIFMVAMTNFFGGVYQIHKRYDLKGSTHGRFASERERSKKFPVFKDLDWIEDGHKLRFPSRAELERVMSQLDRDTSFLSAERLIDYSLLVGLHKMDASEAESWDHSKKIEAVRVVKAESGKDMIIAYYGIIDVLTPYGFRKRGETYFTGTALCCRDVSCQPPEKYKRRFLDFCENEVLACDEESREEAKFKSSRGK